MVDMSNRLKRARDPSYSEMDADFDSNGANGPIMKRKRESRFQFFILDIVSRYDRMPCLQLKIYFKSKF